jgi:hypothetical protein
MARGFESKDVEYQQAEAERAVTVRRPMTPAERARETRCATLQLALARARGDLAAARSAAHAQMLRQGIAALERELANERGDTT